MASPENPSPLPLDGTVAVFDLEWTAWEGSRERGWRGPEEAREIVEIGAVRLDGHDGLREVAALECLVRPRRNPRLSRYFIALTGITQAAVDEGGIDFADALALFREFLERDGLPAAVLSFGQDPAVLRENCTLAGLAFSFDGVTFVNVRPALAAFLGQPQEAVSSGRLPALLGFPPLARAHRALGDARCIAEGLRRCRAAAPPV